MDYNISPNLTALDANTYSQLFRAVLLSRAVLLPTITPTQAIAPISHFLFFPTTKKYFLLPPHSLAHTHSPPQQHEKHIEQSEVRTITTVEFGHGGNSVKLRGVFCGLYTADQKHARMSGRCCCVVHQSSLSSLLCCGEIVIILSPVLFYGIIQLV